MSNKKCSHSFLSQKNILILSSLNIVRVSKASKTHCIADNAYTNRVWQLGLTELASQLTKKMLG